MKDEQIKTNYMKDVMMTFHKIIYLVANFVWARTYRVVKNHKFQKFLRHYHSVKTFFYLLHLNQ